jgi:hypothetical protein
MKFKLFFKIALFACILLAMACKHDAVSDGANGLLGGEDCAYSLKYDAEVTMTTKPASLADMGRLAPQDRVDLMPQTSRSTIDFCLKKNGSSEWLIEKKKPEHVFEAKSYTLPDPSPKIKIVRIKDDRATFIDENGKVIKESPFEVNQLTIGLKDMIKIANNINPTGDFDKMLADARKDGATVSELGGGTYNLTKKLSSPTEAVTVTVTLDKTVGRIVGNAIHDNLGKPKYTVIYNYAQGTKPVLKNVIQRSYKTTRNGISMLTQKIIQFHRLEISGTPKGGDDANSKLD